MAIIVAGLWALPAQDTSEADLKAQLAQAQATIAKMSAPPAAAPDPTLNPIAAATQQRAADAAIAQLADSKAVLAALAAKTQADQLIKDQNQNKLATDSTLVTAILAFLTLLVKAYTDGQHQKWTVEAATTATKAAEDQHAALLLKLGQVGVSADAAYAVANTVNDKIASIGVQMADGKPLNPADRS